MKPQLSASITAFVAHADAFCAFVEGDSPTLPRDFTSGIQLRVAKLYAAGLELPSPTERELGDGEDSDENADLADPNSIEADSDRMSHEEWLRVYRALGARLAGTDMYMEMFDPFGWEDEPVVGSLADDLADIYQEIRAGLLKWRRGDTDDAIWTWRFGLETHWAGHATGAMRALQALVFRYEFAPPGASEQRPNER